MSVTAVALIITFNSHYHDNQLVGCMIILMVLSY